MADILIIVLPVFGLIGLGYLAAVTGYLKKDMGDGLAAFVFNVAVPVLLFRSLASAEFNNISPAYFWVSYFLGVATVWGLATVLSRGVLKRGARAGVIAGVAAGFSNLVLLGIPLIQRAFGEEGLTILFLLIAVHLPIMMAASSFLMEYAVRADNVDNGAIDVPSIMRNLAGNLLKNPIIIGIFIGLAWRVTGIGITGIPRQIIDMIGQTAGPLALFAVGMGLVKYEIKGNVLSAVLLSVLSLVVLPMTVYLIAGPLLKLPMIWLQVAVLAAACPTGINAYLFATHFKVAQGLATNTIVVAMLGATVSIPMWLIFLRSFG